MNNGNKIKYYGLISLFNNSPDKDLRFTISGDAINDITFRESFKGKDTIIKAYKLVSTASEASTFDSAVIDTKTLSGAVCLSGRMESVAGTINIQLYVLLYRGYGYGNGGADEGWEAQALGSAISATGDFILDISTSSYWQNQPARYIKFRFAETGAQQNTYYVHATMTSKGA